MKKTCKFFIDDILEAINKIENYTGGLNYEEFSENGLIVDAVIRNLEIIGEASRNIPEEIKEKYPEIPWKRMIGLRNIVIHEYFGVDLSIVWEIITLNIPETKANIEKMLKFFDE
ncbi:MAG: hypothetical protein CVT88_08905 [Candidatus Altiarchaeales archaeon HGW-Altiarchaeales-1]|nr:MAG: hypothetical protein CVT88_08905 [Candidatus Altiarchaeales archaeon HGW-Altiarchaeales-1]